MRRLSLLLAAVGLVALGGCDANAPEAAAAETADLGTCSAPSISFLSSGTYVTVTGLSSFGSVVEYKTQNASTWSHMKTGGTGATQLASTLWRYTGVGTKERVDFRARNLCYSGGTYSFSGTDTDWVYYNAEGP